ncbi:MAG: DUF5667 domain-containing protein [Anaerolineales bacterium]
MNKTLVTALEDCLKRIKAGARLESCLSSYPDQAHELEPLLRLAEYSGRLAKIGPRPSFARTARIRLENQMKTPKTSATPAPLVRRWWQKPMTPVQRRFGVVQTILAVMLALSAAAAGVAYAADASKPGDILYGLDRALEQVQQHMATSEASKLELRLAFAEERLLEAQSLFSQSDVAHGVQALDEYRSQVSTFALLIGNTQGADQEALLALLEAAQASHTDILTSLLGTTPEQAHESIQEAIEASDLQISDPVDTPADVGAPDDAGASDDAGSPVQTPGGPPDSLPGGPP